MVILVLGASGQLGQSIKALSANYSRFQFTFCSSEEADITDLKMLTKIFSSVNPKYCINAAAYTAVDKAEAEVENAYAINAAGAANVARACAAARTILIHISTDFIFDGKKRTPYTEADDVNPQNVYGKSKYEGELEIRKILPEHIIIRTSWLYSQFGHNFMRTMLTLATQRDYLNVVNDQTGCPTSAADLAQAILNIIASGKSAFGTFHYSNSGQASWYDFAAEIFRMKNIRIGLNAISTDQYPTPAKRPAYSVLDTSKINTVFGLEIRSWKEALRDVISDYR